MSRPAAFFDRAGTRTEPVDLFFQWSLLGLLASGFFALAGSGYLDLPATILTGTGLILRAVLVAGGQRLAMSGSAIAALTLAYIGFYPIDYAYLSREFIPATVHLICFLAVLRVLTARSNRDYFFVKIIAFLELLGATLLSSSLNFFVFLSMFLIFGVATFCCTEIRRSSQAGDRVVAIPRGFHRRLILLTASITSGTVVMTAGLFFVLPRTARAALSSFVSERYHLPGFSNEVTLGQIGELQQRTTPLLHVRIEGAANERLPLKWRGAALSRFDGKRWYNPHAYSEPIRVNKGLAILATDAQRRRHGTRIRYEVKIDTIGSDALLFAGVPEFVQTNLALIFRSPGDSFRTGLGSSDSAHYYAFSYLPKGDVEPSFEIGPLPLPVRAEHLLLPALDARIPALAEEAGTGSTPEERAASMERYLRTHYSYTTELLNKPVPDPLANFLFERRQGYCEYFASSMAVMLRTVGIPSRVVTGFQSGVYNPMTNWFLIRASDAHSWVEAWLPGRGWTVFDPTPPDQRGQTPAIFFSKLGLLLDAADTFWQQWVMHYGIDQQIDLAYRLQSSSKLLAPSNWQFRVDEGRRAARSAWNSAQPWLGSAMSVVAFCLLAWMFGPRLWRLSRERQRLRRIRGGHAGASDAAMLYGRMLDVLRRRGWEKPSWLTPDEFANGIPASPASSLVRKLTVEYHQLRYGGSSEAAARMIELLRQLEATR